MTDSERDHVHHPPITGAPGELLDLFMELVDREPERDPHWWFNYGELTLGNFTRGLIPRGMDRVTAMGALREVITEAIDAGVAEDFLIQALRRDLDEFVRGREDPSIYNAHVDGMRKTMQDVIDDPEARARWRDARARVTPAYADKSDDEVIEDARRALASSVTTRYVSADEAAERWTDAQEWWAASQALLPDVVFKHWRKLNIDIQIEESKAQE